MPPETWWKFGLIILTVACCAAGTSGTVNCVSGHFGPACAGVCHCRDGDGVCNSQDGRCASGGCARGYTGHPLCQTPCPPGTFGADCSLTCRCPADDVCDGITGLCQGGVCLYGWDGPACQLRLPVITKAPDITSNSAGDLVIQWRSWNPLLDIGEPPIGLYTLEYQQEKLANVWLTAAELAPINDQNAMYSHQMDSLLHATRYRFRLRLSRLDNGKLQPSIPGPATDFVFVCQGAPEPPSDLSANVQQFNEYGVNIEVSWTPPSSPPLHSCATVTAHIIRVYCQRSCMELLATVPLPSTSTTFSFLPFNDRVEVKVFALDSAGRQSTEPAITYLDTYAQEDMEVISAPAPEIKATPPQVATTVTSTQKTTPSAPVSSVTPPAPKTTTPTSVSNKGDPVLTTTTPTSSSHNDKSGVVHVPAFDVTVTNRTETSLTISWQPGTVAVETYRVTATLHYSYVTSDGVGILEQAAVVSDTTATVGGLLPSSRYLVAVSGNTGDVFYGAITTTAWTAPRAPEFPDAPILTENPKNGTVWLHMSAIGISTGLLNAVEIVVELMTPTSPVTPPEVAHHTRHSRGLNDEADLDGTGTGWGDGVLDYYLAMKAGHSLYITMTLSAYDVKYESIIVVGSGNTVNGYYNAPLHDDSASNIWLCVVSALDGLSKRACSLTPGSDGSAYTVDFRSSINTAAQAQRSKANTAAIVVPIVLLLLIIIAILIYIGYRKYGHRDMDNSFGNIATYHHGPTLADISLNNGSKPEKCNRTSTPKHTSPTRITKSGGQRSNLKAEFMQLPAGLVHSTSVARQDSNKALNRSMRVIPFDRNRVQLSDNYAGSDYINASIVKVSAGQCYLVTQTPLQGTRAAFWKMVWDYNVERIVMLVSWTKKNVEYWESHRPVVYGDIHVETRAEKALAFCSSRQFNVSKAGTQEVRSIHHYRFHSWKSNGIPVHTVPFQAFLQQSNSAVSSGGMCLVHCQTGGGKSGLHIALETLLCDATNHHPVDVYSRVSRLRHERPLMVATQAQYNFIYECLKEYTERPYRFIPIDQIKSCLDFLLSTSGADGMCLMYKEFKALNDPSMHLNDADDDDDHNSVFHSPSPNAIDLSAISPSDSLLKIPKPIMVSSHFKEGAFLLKPSPASQSQAQEIWSDIWANGVATMVMFGQSDETLQYWPNDGCEIQVNAFMVQTVNVTCRGGTNMLTRDFTVKGPTSKGFSHTQEVRQFQFQGWTHASLLPPVTSFLGFVQVVRAYVCTGGFQNPVLVHCEDGANRSALFACVWKLLEQADDIGAINIFKTARLLRHVVKGAIPTMDQYRFCYRIIKEYHKIVTQVRGQKGSKSTPATNEMDDNCNAANNNNGNRNSNLCQEDGNSYDERKNFLSNSVTEYQPELNLRENTIVSKVGHHGSVLMTYADTTHARKSSFQPGNSVSQGTIFIPGHGQNFETSTGSSSQAKQSSQSTVGLSSQSKSVRFQEQHVYSTTSAGIPHSNKLAEEVPPVLSNSK